MNKKFKISLIQNVAGLACIALAVPSKSLMLFFVGCVLVWIGGRGLMKCFSEKDATDK